MTNPELSETALLTSSRGMTSRFRVFMPTPAQPKDDITHAILSHGRLGSASLGDESGIAPQLCMLCQTRRL